MCIRDSIQSWQFHLLCSLAFLLRCQDSAVIPRFLKLKNTIFTPQAGNVCRRAEQAMLRECIHQIKKDLPCNDKNQLTLHLKLSCILSRGHWDMVNGLTTSAFEAVRNSVRAPHECTYWRDCPEENTRQKQRSLDMYRTVNISDRQLSDIETTVLARWE